MAFFRLNKAWVAIKVFGLSAVIGMTYFLVAKPIPAEALTGYDIPDVLNTSITPYDNTCVTNPNKYAHYGWVSPSGIPKNMTSVTVPYGTTVVPLQFQTMVFLCHQVVTLDKCPFCRIYSSGAVPPGYFPVDGVPNGFASLRRNYTYIHTASVIAGGGGISNSPAGRAADIGYNGGSRYWFSTPLGFNYTSAPLTTTKTITIRLTTSMFNTFSSGNSFCVATGAPTVGIFPPFGCPILPVDFTIQVIVTPAPPAGVDLQINGSDTPAAINIGDAITASWTSHDCVSPPTPPLSASNQWSGNKVANGNENRTADSGSAGLKTYTLTCTGGDGNIVTDTVFVNVLAPQPYVTTALASIQAGVDWDSEPCFDSSNPAGSISGRVGSSAGSKSDYIASSGADINNFGSAGSPTSSSLQFSNGATPGFYGRVCRADFAKYYLNDQPATQISPPADTIAASAVGNGVSRIIPSGAGVTLTGGNIPKGRNATLVVQGDVYISGNITYDTTGYTGLSNIPSFGVIASGNIHIAPSVSNLYGIYYAGTNTSTWDPGHSDGGIINTCRTGFGRNPDPPLLSIQANQCNGSLRFDGALVAGNIYFRRVFGNVNSGSGAAETISLIPQLLLHPPTGLAGVTTQIRSQGERPPVF